MFSGLARSSPRSTLFPYTTLFRSWNASWLGCPRKNASSWFFATLSGSSTVISLMCSETRRMAFVTSTTRPCLPLAVGDRSEEHTSELQSRFDLVCRLLLEKKNSGQRPVPARDPELKAGGLSTLVRSRYPPHAAPGPERCPRLDSVGTAPSPRSLLRHRRRV